MRYLGDGTQVQRWNSLMFYTYIAHVAWNVSLQCCLHAYLLTISHSSSMAFPICSIMLLLEKFLTGLIWTFLIRCDQSASFRTELDQKNFQGPDYYLCWWGFTLVLQLWKHSRIWHTRRWCMLLSFGTLVTRTVALSIGLTHICFLQRSVFTDLHNAYITVNGFYRLD